MHTNTLTHTHTHVEYCQTSFLCLNSVFFSIFFSCCILASICFGFVAQFLHWKCKKIKTNFLFSSESGSWSLQSGSWSLNCCWASFWARTLIYSPWAFGALGAFPQLNVSHCYFSAQTFWLMTKTNWWTSQSVVWIEFLCTYIFLATCLSVSLSHCLTVPLSRSELTVSGHWYVGQFASVYTLLHGACFYCECIGFVLQLRRFFYAALSNTGPLAAAIRFAVACFLSFLLLLSSFNCFYFCRLCPPRPCCCLVFTLLLL